MTTRHPLPSRKEIWLVNFDPTVGAEIRKIRPALVISSDSVGRLPIKLIVPITDWKMKFSNNFWHIKIEPSIINGLEKTSALDTLQLRGVDSQRFIRKLGSASANTMQEVAVAIATVIELDFIKELGG